MSSRDRCRRLVTAWCWRAASSCSAAPAVRAYGSLRITGPPILCLFADRAAGFDQEITDVINKLEICCATKVVALAFLACTMDEGSSACVI